jgi:hypothetical protein
VDVDRLLPFVRKEGNQEKRYFRIEYAGGDRLAENSLEARWL